MSRSIKRNRGSVAALAFVALVPLIGCIGGFAVDCMHFADQKGALQRATDAAALAGALSLYKWKWGKTNSNSVTGAGNADGVNRALEVAAASGVDSDGLYQLPPTRTVLATLQYQGNPGAVSSTQRPDQCQVDGMVVVKSLLFSLMHNNFGGQSTTTHSVAGSGVVIDTLVTYFPMVVGKSKTDSYGDPALDSVPIGGTFKFNTRKVAGIEGNAAWTMGGSGHGESDFDAVAQDLLNGNPPSQAEDTITTGQNAFAKKGTQDSLIQDVALAMNGHIGDIIVVPVTDDTGLANNVNIVGFVALQIQSAYYNDTVAPHVLEVTTKVVGQYIGNGISRGSGTQAVAPYNNVQTVSLIK
jgi:hypothetical protein